MRLHVPYPVCAADPEVPLRGADGPRCRRAVRDVGVAPTAVRAACRAKEGWDACPTAMPSTWGARSSPSCCSTPRWLASWRFVSRLHQRWDSKPTRSLILYLLNSLFFFSCFTFLTSVCFLYDRSLFTLRISPWARCVSIINSRSWWALYYGMCLWCTKKRGKEEKELVIKPKLDLTQGRNMRCYWSATHVGFLSGRRESTTPLNKCVVSLSIHFCHAPRVPPKKKEK